MYTNEQLRAKERGELVIDDFAHAYKVHRRIQSGRATAAERRAWTAMSPTARRGALNYGEVMAEDERERRHDIETRGQVAVDFYAALGKLPVVVLAPPRAAGRRPAGTPAGRRRRAAASSRTSSADPGDDPDPGEPSWLAGHSDTETVAAPFAISLPQDEWLGGEF